MKRAVVSEWLNVTGTVIDFLVLKYCHLFSIRYHFEIFSSEYLLLYTRMYRCDAKMKCGQPNYDLV